MLVFLFWFSLLFILYTYLGYPCLLFVWAKLFPKKVKKFYLNPEPTVSVIIAAHNEGKIIGQRIQNMMEQNYPPGKMEIIIVSDGSTDDTNTIVQRLMTEREVFDGNRRGSCRVKLIELEQNRGKAHAINTGFCEATGDFIVFSDARQVFDHNAVRELLANFSDASVGCVSGELVFVEGFDTSIRTEILFYWNFEKWIRKLESKIHSVAGATGAIYAIRKSLFRPIPEDTLLDDVFVPMNIVFQNFRVIFEDKAVAYDKVSKDFRQEKRRKVRTLMGNYQLLQIMPKLLMPVGNPIFFRYLSHKVLRLFIPFFFLTLIFSSYLINGLFYKICLSAAIIMLLLPFMGKIIPQGSWFGRVCKLATAFVFLNYFAFIAFFFFLIPGKNKW